MKLNHPMSTCAGCPLNRRNFLAKGGAAAAGALALLSTPSLLRAAEPKPKTRIRIDDHAHGQEQGDGSKFQ